jgi:hypothetical protein
MKAFLRIVLGSLLVASVTVSQFPAPARCQMQALSFATACQLPCCKAASRIPLNCPMMKAAPVKDTIASSPLILPFVLHLFAVVAEKAALRQLLRSSWLATVFQTLSPTTAAHALLTRAPPADIALLSA